MIETAVTTERKLCSPASVRVRKARLSDVNAMHRIINYYADRQLMLPKSHLQLYENLRDYSVAADTADDSTVLGCGGLHIYWENLAEIRALAVLAERARKSGRNHLIPASLVCKETAVARPEALKDSGSG